MKAVFKLSNLLFGIFFALLLCFVLALSGSQQPLSGAEVETYLSKIQQQSQVPGGRHDLSALRHFLESDDGLPFYTVNLYKFNEQAQYLDGRDNPGTGRQAYDRFSAVMVKLLAKQFSQPIFGSDWMADNSNDWHRLVIVHYRSRRDIAEIFASDAFADAAADKWASIEKNERLLVQGLHIPALKWLAVTLLVLLTLAFVCLKLRRRENRFGY
ncbi:hypothetical protein [Thalassomonas haliotis]|uniref:DUF1330 domain-containing protein n=1 Tax=Thalassomonas haliotis TaxID=485448 RepID=A0ABY7VCR4_9GAMM|nr:hypothetical protein [Thalassomonas haliotis]WDE11462.1 hypothetical protein H3N35_25155 [Thalassomonas haliotis]